MKQTFIGIDIAKAQLDLYETAGHRHIQFENTKTGIKQCVSCLKTLSPSLIVLENTGGYELELVLALEKTVLPFSVVNPRWVRDFGRATGRLAKTDCIDAALLAEYGKRLNPSCHVPQTPQSRLMKALTKRRHQLLSMKTAESNRREHSRERDIARSIAGVIKMLDRQIANVERRLRSLIETQPELQHKMQIMTSIPGIAETTATMLITEVPELGQISRRQIAALIGVAPINRDSGTFRGRRMTGGGRYLVRTRLFMPTLVVCRHNPHLRNFYMRLLKNGKTKMTAIIATMRKLLAIINTMIAKDQSWNPETT